MESLNTFFHIIAWVLGVGASLLLVIRLFFALTYSETERILDKMNGKVVTFPVKWPAIVALVCWAYIIAF